MVLRFLSVLAVAASALAAPAHCPGWTFNGTAAREAMARAHEILGVYAPCEHLCNWMSRKPDHTPLVSLSIPGTHDTATWNYTQETQDRHKSLTGNGIAPAYIYQCQDQSIIQQLNAGMRAFDLRVGIAPDGTTVGFFHAAAVLSTSATLADVMYGFYTFLHANPSETLVLSVKVDNTTWGTPAQLQQELHQYFTAYPARAFFVDGDSLGTLGAARGKITLLRRFDLSLLPANESRALGLDVSSGWADNDAGFSITYDVPRNKSVYIEDYYEIGGPAGTASKVQWKYNATAAHLAKAAHEHEDSLFVTFASAEQDYDVPPEYPRIIALGNNSDVGVNQKLLPYLRATRGHRRGVVLTDWYAQVDGLIEGVISL